MTKESCHGETAREMLCSRQPFPKCSQHPHTGSSSSSAPQSQVPRGDLAKVTLSKTSVICGCCLWQCVPMMGMCFNCCQARKEMWDVLLPTQGIAWALGVQQPGTEQHPYKKTQPVLAILSYQPVSKSQSFQKLVCFFF